MCFIVLKDDYLIIDVLSSIGYVFKEIDAVVSESDVLWPEFW
jgi:hypothetical protein